MIRLGVERRTRITDRRLTVATEVGDIELATPRDLAGSFEPRLVSKGARRVGGLDAPKGLVPKGPDPASGKGSYVDPVTGQATGVVSSIVVPSTPHANNPAVERQDINGNIVAPESPEAHLPFGTRR